MAVPTRDGTFSIVLERFTPMEAALASQLKRDFGRLNRSKITQLVISIAAFLVAAIASIILVETAWFVDLVLTAWFADNNTFGESPWSLPLFMGAAFGGGFVVALVVAGILQIAFRRQRRRIRASLRALWASPYASSLLGKLLKFQAAQAEAEQHDDLFHFITAELVSAPELVVARARVAVG
ncbi:MAG: hypothetical protein Q8R35_03375 [bacterium]|nr:hypothetical protein [bacterium]